MEQPGRLQSMGPWGRTWPSDWTALNNDSEMTTVLLPENPFQAFGLSVIYSGHVWQSDIGTIVWHIFKGPSDMCVNN